MVLHAIMTKIESIIGADLRSVYTQSVLIPSLHESWFLFLLICSLASLLPSSFSWETLSEWFTSYTALSSLFASIQEESPLSELLENDLSLTEAFQKEEDRFVALKQSVIQQVVGVVTSYLEEVVLEEVLLTELYTYSDQRSSIDNRVTSLLDEVYEKMEQYCTRIRNSIPEKGVQTGIVFRCLRVLDREMKERLLHIHYDRVVCIMVLVSCRREGKH